jgi:23S rRNA (guanosine2251-2'-O)-methyltransferase
MVKTSGKHALKEIAYGRRAVLELLESGLEMTELFIIPGGTGDVFERICREAETKGIRMVRTSRAEIDRITRSEDHQGVAAFYIPPEVLDMGELLARQDKAQKRPLMVVDGIEDPRNLGAVIRSAEVLGAGGVAFRRHRAAGLTPAVVKSSAGAALRFPIAAAPNTDAIIRLLKKSGYWIYGLDAEAKVSLWEAEFTDPVCFIVGAEGKGLARLVREGCDFLLRIPQVGRIGSLNVSVSASIALSEWMRRNMRKTEQGLDLSI